MLILSGIEAYFILIKIENGVSLASLFGILEKINKWYLKTLLMLYSILPDMPIKLKIKNLLRIKKNEF